jgi:hypothetical protein
MKKIKELPMLRLACAIALAMPAQLAFGQDQVAEHEPVALPLVTFPAAAENVKEESWNAYGQLQARAGH